MDKKEYTTKASAIAQAYNAEMAKLDKEYAEEHNPVEVGDYVSVRAYAIRVKGFSVVKDTNGIPMMRYKGVRCKKNGKEIEGALWQWADQNCITAINGEAYTRIV